MMKDRFVVGLCMIGLANAPLAAQDRQQQIDQRWLNEVLRQPAQQPYRPTYQNYQTYQSNQYYPQNTHVPGPDRGGRLGITFDGTLPFNGGAGVHVVDASQTTIPGLRPGVYILSVNGWRFNDGDTFSALVKENPPGAPVRIVFADPAQGYQTFVSDGTLVADSRTAQSTEYAAAAPPDPQPSAGLGPSSYSTYSTQPDAGPPEAKPSNPAPDDSDQRLATAQGDLNSALDRYVADDGSHWYWDTYRKGSMHNSRIISQSSDGRTYVAHGEYLYDGKVFSEYADGVQATVTDGRMTCVRYDEEGGLCRAPYVTDQSIAPYVIGAVAVGVIALAALSSSSSSSSGSGYHSSSAYHPTPRSEDYPSRADAPATPAPPREPKEDKPPMEPIGGWDKVFGCGSPPCR